MLFRSGIGSLYYALQLKKEADRHTKNAREFTENTNGDRLDPVTTGKDTPGSDYYVSDGTHANQNGFLSVKDAKPKDDMGSSVLKWWDLNGQKADGFGKLTAVSPQCVGSPGVTPGYDGCVIKRKKEIEDRITQSDRRHMDAADEMSAIGRTAANEQKEMARKANGKFMENAAGAIVAFVQAKLANDTAKSLKEAEVAVRPNPNPSSAGFTFQGADPFADSNGIAPGNAQVIDGGSVQASAAEAGPDPRSSAPPPGGFGDVPFAKQPGSDKAGNPDPGAFNAGNGGGGASGGGGGGSGGGSTSPSAGGAEGDKEPQSSYAGLGKNSGAYESGGGARPAGGGGAAGGPDLSGLLAQFLPKDKDAGPDNGILEFGSRAPAAGNTDSLLDSSVNIFERVHEAYQTKSRKGFGR